MFGRKNKYNHENKVNLGDLVSDKISGYTGVVECISEWLNSCRRITITPTKLKDGMPMDNKTFDEYQVQLVEAGYFDKPTIKKDQKTGGPEIKPKRNDDPV